MKFLDDILVKADILTDGVLKSTYTAGSPLSVVSDILNTNLNADLLDDYHALELLSRSNHTGFQAISTITGLQAALDMIDNRWISSYTAVSDLNTTDQGGVKYWGGSTLNTPFPYGTSLTFVGVTNTGDSISGGGYTNQILAATDAEVYFRQRINAGSWTSFLKLWSTKHFTQTDINNWNTAYLNSHTHSNKAILDGITTTNISQWTNNSGYITSAALSGLVSGSGTVNYIPLWTAAGTQGNSYLYQDSTYLNLTKNLRVNYNGSTFYHSFTSDVNYASFSMLNPAVSAGFQLLFDNSNNNIVFSTLVSGSGYQSAMRILSDKSVTFYAPSGTAPFNVSSATLVTNLNADLLDGLHASAFALASHTHTASQITDFTTAGRALISGTGSISYNSTTGVISYTGGAGVGSVTSVGLSAPTGLTVSGSPVTSSGTLALSYTSGYSIPTTAKQTDWDAAYNSWIAGTPVADMNNSAKAGVSAWEYTTTHRPSDPYGVYLTFSGGYAPGGNGAASGSWINQLAASTSGDLFFRQSINDWTVWGGFYKLWTERHFTQADINAWTYAYNQLGSFVRIASADNITADHNFTGHIKLPGEYYHNLLTGYNATYTSFYPSGGNGSTSTQANLRVWNGPGNTYKALILDGGGAVTWGGVNLATESYVTGRGYITASSSDNLTNKSGNISQWTNNSGYITGINSSMVTTALGYTPYNSSNPAGYITSSALSGYATQTYVNSQGFITGINNTMVVSALGYSPYNASNPNGYITSSALSGYATTGDRDFLQSQVNSINGYTITINGSTKNINSNPNFTVSGGGGGVSGSGSIAQIPVWNGSTSLGDSWIYNGTNILGQHEIIIGNSSSRADLYVNGVLNVMPVTAAQRASLSTLWTGAMVYQTDGTEGLYIKKSSGWVFLG